jgi:single-strand DNA-binding protein
MQVTVTGNLTGDPELKFNESGSAMLTFSVASERSWKNDRGEWESEVSYPDVIAWRQLAEAAAAIIGKGLRVVVTGRFEQRFWEDKETGQRRSKWQLVADEIAVSTKVLESIERKRKEDGPFDGPRNGNGRSSSRPPQRTSSTPVTARSGGRQADPEAW